MKALRFVLAGVALGLVFVGLFPTPEPPAPMDTRPVSGPIRLDEDPAVGGDCATSDEALLPAAVAGPRDRQPSEAGEALGQTERATPVGGQHEEVVAAAAVGDETAGPLRRAESRLAEMLASRRKAPQARADRPRAVLRQPRLVDLAGLLPEAPLEGLAKLTCPQRPPEDPPGYASTEEPSCDTMPGPIVPTSYNAPRPVGDGEPEEAAVAAAREALPREPARKLPGLAPLSRFGSAVGDWLAERLPLPALAPMP